jgi:hypothetical protein
MPDLDALARRAVDAVMLLARRGALLALTVAIVTTLVVGAGYALGLAAMSGDVESAWIAIGGVLAVIAIGAPLLAGWRLLGVRRHAGELVGEVRTLLTKDARAERVVIETVEVGDDGTGGATPAVVGQTVQFSRLRTLALGTENLRRLPDALRAVTTFPVLLAVALVLMLVFGVLGFLFLIAWAI